MTSGMEFTISYESNFTKPNVTKHCNCLKTLTRATKNYSVFDTFSDRCKTNCSSSFRITSFYRKIVRETNLFIRTLSVSLYCNLGNDIQGNDEVAHQ